MSQTYKFSCGCEFPIAGPSPNDGRLPAIKVDINNIREDCADTWSLLARGITKGVFQLETHLGKTWAKKLKPENLEHMAALGALLRPGCLKAKDTEGVSMTEHYCRRKNKQEEVEYYHPALKPILENTYGILTFQEESLRIAQDIAGFNLADADIMRRAVSKKKADEMAKVKKMFLKGAKQQKLVTEQEAEEIFGWIEQSQKYSFNRCIAGNTIIRRFNCPKIKNKLGYSVEHMYNVRNNLQYAKKHGHESLHKKWKKNNNYAEALSLQKDNRIRPNTIIDITLAGKRKIKKITLKNGNYIRVTDTHEFPTDNGIVLTKDLKIGDKLYVCGKYDPQTNQTHSKFSKITREYLQVRAKNAKRDGKEIIMSGKNHPGYTNGSYTEFIKNKEKLPNYCEHCGKNSGRLETHHKDKNREDSSLENLERLCPSCHKKADYKLGRRKRGEKGYPIIKYKIVSIKDDGIDNTYDVTMKAPHHNFVTGQGIITCNSHAVSYGINGYISAYLKTHFPLQFYTSYLYYSKDKQKPLEEIRELVNDAKLMDIEVVPPTILNNHTHFYIDKEKIFFGLSDIKGVGEKHVQKLNERKQSLDQDIEKWSWQEWLIYYVNKSVINIVEKLIKAGAFRHCDKSRTEMLAELSTWSQLTDKEQEWVRKQNITQNTLADLIEKASPKKKDGGGAANKNRTEKLRSLSILLKNPPTSMKDNPAWIANVEEELLGISLTHHRVDSCHHTHSTSSCKEFLSGRINNINLAVEINNFREVTCKRGQSKGRKMGFLTISDSSCSLESVTVFPDIWNEYRNLISDGNTVLIKGYKDKKTDSLIVKKIEQI